jgi:glycosyltransferase involved in cell wall biosynthesis
MPLLSVIMPVKDGAAYVDEAVRSLQAQALRDWELVVVDDHSADDTARIVRSLGGSDGRVALVENPGRGQVQAINFGFGLSRGDWLKIMDADDLLAPGFSDAFGRLAEAEATYHDALLLDGRPGPRRTLRVGPRFGAMSLADSLRRIQISPPRWSWTVARSVADRVLPLPADLPSPHEDVFLGLMIKKNARVSYVPRPLYLYRQHAGQFYGGLFNYSTPAVIRRARAMLGIIDLVGRSEIVRDVEDAEALLAASRACFILLGRDRLTWGDILRARLGLGARARVAVIRKAPRAASWMSRRRAVGKLKDQDSDQVS